MAYKTHCDRCDKVIESTEEQTALKLGFQVWDIKKRLFYDDEGHPLNLCLECSESLKQFMNNGKTE